jgi:hypothetical protein
MATQRVTIATLIGESTDVANALFNSWRADPAAANVAVDSFCEQIRLNGHLLPIVYFCEWIDRWLMGDQVPGPDALEGRRFQAVCFSPDEAIAWAEKLGTQFDEQLWFAARLREAADGWGLVVEKRAVVVTREALAASTCDEEVVAASRALPNWLLPFCEQ